MLKSRARQFLAHHDEFFTICLSEGASNSGFGLSSLGHLQPSGLRILTLRGDDLNRLAIAQTGP